MGVALLSSHLKGVATKNFQAPVRFYPGSAPAENIPIIFEVCLILFLCSLLDSRPGGGGVLDLNLYEDVPTKKNFFTLLQNFCLQMILCSRENL